MNIDPDIERQALREQADAIREGQRLGKSATLAVLFDYLVQTTLDGRSPKEAEIADAVFGRGADFDAIQDASVRVYVHRLRRKLEDYYAGEGADAEWHLAMPRGEYRLRLVNPAVEATEAEPVEAAVAAPPPSPPPARRGRPWAIALASAGVTALLALVVGLFLLRPDAATSELEAVRRSALWAPTVAPGRNTVVVIGDYYIFGEADGKGDLKRLVREFPINSRYDLDEHLMQHPELIGHYVDLGLRYYPIGVASALRDILPILRSENLPGPVRVIPSSDLAPDMLRVSDIVYIGYLSGLGTLRNAVFNGSRYAIGASYDDLIDTRTRRHLTATTGIPSNMPQQDYAYISTFRGPNANRIIVIAGTRDAAVMQAAEYVSRRAGTDAIAAGAKGAAAFEAVLRVDTLGDQNVGGKLVQVSPLNAAAIWRPSSPQVFPDDEKNETPPE